MKKLTAKSTRTAKQPKATIPATLATEWAGTRLSDAELYSAMKSRAMELGQNASNAGRSAKAAIQMVDRAADVKALAEVKAGQKRKAGLEPKTRPTPAAKGSTHVFQIIETAEYLADQLQQLTPKAAAKINAGLEADGSVGRWVPIEAAKETGNPTTTAAAKAAIDNRGIPSESSDTEAPATPAVTDAPVLTEAAVQLLQRLITEDSVTVSGAGLGLAVTAGFLAKKELIAITSVGKDRVAALTEKGRLALDVIAAHPEAVRKPRLTTDGKSAPQWVVKFTAKGAEKAEWLGRNYTHELAVARAAKHAEAAGLKLTWEGKFKATAKGAEYSIARVGNGDPKAALKAESAAA